MRILLIIYCLKNKFSVHPRRELNFENVELISLKYQLRKKLDDSYQKMHGGSGMKILGT